MGSIDAFDQIETVLCPYADRIGKDYEGYKNHCVRVLNFLNRLRPISADEREKLIVAVAFHDIGLWTHNTVDYLPPSILEMQNYLIRLGKPEWGEELSMIIDMHHKLTPDQGRYELVEFFRKADLLDFSLGFVRFGISKAYVARVKQQFPNKGFHRMLLVRTLKWLPLHPLRPMPIIKF